MLAAEQQEHEECQQMSPYLSVIIYNKFSTEVQV